MPHLRYTLTVVIEANVAVYAPNPEAAKAAITNLLSEPTIHIRKSELVVEHAEVTGVFDAHWQEQEMEVKP